MCIHQAPIQEHSLLQDVGPLGRRFPLAEDGHDGVHVNGGKIGGVVAVGQKGVMKHFIKYHSYFCMHNCTYAADYIGNKIVSYKN